MRMRSEEKGGTGKEPKWDLEGGSVAVVPHGHELLEGLDMSMTRRREAG
jgi:hypothetical protein